MKREETKIIEQTLYRNLFGNNPKLAREYGTNEVTLGFSRDGRINNGKTEIVDFLSYDVRKDFSVTEEDFVKTMTDYLLFKEEIDVKELMNSISNKILYHSELKEDGHDIKVSIKRSNGSNEL